MNSFIYIMQSICWNHLQYLSLALGAVSYTHLRAHETRHDLVCRLLLEKKRFDERSELESPVSNNNLKTGCYSQLKKEPAWQTG